MFRRVYPIMSLCHCNGVWQNNKMKIDFKTNLKFRLYLPYKIEKSFFVVKTPVTVLKSYHCRNVFYMLIKRFLCFV